MRKIWHKFEEHMTPIIVVISFGIVLIYSIVCMVLAQKGTIIDGTLTEYFFKFFGFEMLGLSGIKISKHISSAFGNVEDMVDGSDDEDDTDDTESEEG